MPLYQYRAADLQGNIIEGSLDAREEGLVVLHLQQGGLIPLRISTEAVSSPWQGRLAFQRGLRVSTHEVVYFSEELADLLKAGLPLDRSLQALKAVVSRPGMKKVIDQILRDLQGGKTLAESLTRHKIFSPLYISLIHAGETGGFLEESLSRLSDYLQTVSEFRSYLFTALIYPMILAGVGSLSLILMLLYVVPRFESFFQEMGQELFWSTRLLLWVSQGFRSYWWVLVLVLAVLVWSTAALLKSPKGQLWVDRFRIQAPLLGSLTRNVAASFFAKTLGTLLQNGVPLVVALQVVITSVDNRYLAGSIRSVLDSVEKGKQLSVMLKKVGMFPELFLQMAAIGEETGHLAEMLLSAADSMEKEAKKAIRRLLALLEPVLILITALAVAFIIVSLLLPILNLYEIQL